MIKKLSPTDPINLLPLKIDEIIDVLNDIEQTHGIDIRSFILKTVRDIDQGKTTLKGVRKRLMVFYKSLR